MEPSGRGDVLSALPGHIRSLPAAVQSCTRCYIYMEAEGVRMNQTKNFSGLVSLMLAVLIGALPFAAPEACAQALREGLTLCSGPLLLSLYPFLVVSALLIQCPLGDVLALPFRSVAWLVGVYAPCAARVLLVGFLGGFAPAANASAEAVRSGQMTPEEADRLLPACVCSGPSFVILTVGQTLLGSTEVGVLLFLAQITANYLCAALLSRLSRTNRNEKGYRRARNSRKCRSCAWMAFWRSPR